MRRVQDTQSLHVQLKHLVTHGFLTVQGAVLSACGHMYLDDGEELSTGTARDNFLSFSASGNTTSGQVATRGVRRHTLLSKNADAYLSKYLKAYISDCSALLVWTMI